MTVPFFSRCKSILITPWLALSSSFIFEESKSNKLSHFDFTVFFCKLGAVVNVIKEVVT